MAGDDGRVPKLLDWLAFEGFAEKHSGIRDQDEADGGIDEPHGPVAWGENVSVEQQTAQLDGRRTQYVWKNRN